MKRRLIEWLGPIVWEYYAATEGSGTRRRSRRVAAQAGHRRPGRPARPRPHPRRRRRRASPPATIGTVYLKAPDDDRFEYFKAPEKTDGAYRGDALHPRRRRLRRRRRLPLPHRSQRAPDHQRRREHLSGRGRGGAARASRRSATSASSGVPDDEWGEIVVAAVELQPGVEADRELAAELVEWCRDRIAHYKCPRRVDLRRGAAPARQRQALQAPAARAAPTESREMSEWGSATAGSSS